MPDCYWLSEKYYNHLKINNILNLCLMGYYCADHLGQYLDKYSD